MPVDFVNPVNPGPGGRQTGPDDQPNQEDFSPKQLETARQFVKPPLFVAFSGAESGALRNSEGGYLTIGAWGAARNKL